jgi:hypothetical protein
MKKRLIHTNSYLAVALMYHHTLLQPKPSILHQIWISLTGHILDITWGLA